MDWLYFNVHWETYNGLKGKRCVTALSKNDARTVAENFMKMDNDNGFPFEGKVIKVIGPLGVNPPTPKQLLGRKYGFIIGGIKGAQRMFAQANTDLIIGAGSNAVKCEKGRILVDAQFAKLKRDIRDVFKLAGLKVK